MWLQTLSHGSVNTGYLVAVEVDTPAELAGGRRPSWYVSGTVDRLGTVVVQGPYPSRPAADEALAWLLDKLQVAHRHPGAIAWPLQLPPPEIDRAEAAASLQEAAASRAGLLPASREAAAAGELARQINGGRAPRLGEGFTRSQAARGW